MKFALIVGCLLAAALIAVPAHADPAPKLKPLTPQLAPITPATSELPPARMKEFSLGSDSSHRYQPPTINCTLPIDRIGGAMFNEALITLKNGYAEVRSRYGTSETAPYLTGTIIRQDDAGTADGAERRISGLVLFTGGTYFEQLVDPAAGGLPVFQDDQVFRDRGAVLGKITGVQNQQLLVRARDGNTVPIAFADVKYMRSPHAFLFTIYGKASANNTRTQVDRISFQSTNANVRLGDTVVVGKQPDPLGLDEDDLDMAPLTPTRYRPIDPSADQLPPWMRGGRAFPNWP